MQQFCMVSSPIGENLREGRKMMFGLILSAILIAVAVYFIYSVYSTCRDAVRFVRSAQREWRRELRRRRKHVEMENGVGR